MVEKALIFTLMVSWLVKDNLMCQDDEELSPLHVAARDGYGECVMILVKAGADVRFGENIWSKIQD